MDQLRYRHLVGVAYTEDEMKAIAAEVKKELLKDRCFQMLNMIF